MIWIVSDDENNDYKEPFSKGAIMQALSILDIGEEKAHEISKKIENQIIENSISEISNFELVGLVIKELEDLDGDTAVKFKNWIALRKFEKPIIILIGGSSGVGTSSMAIELANRLKLKNIIGTDMIREVMRKMASKELLPTLHKSSFDAYEGVKNTSMMIDPVIDGFTSQVEVVNVGVEAIIERSIKEGISTIIEGVHVVPGFIRKDLLENNNIIMFTLTVNDEDSHKQRFHARCRKPWVNRSLDSYLGNFDTIRKTQKFLIVQSKLNDVRIINNVDISKTADKMVDDILETFVVHNDING